MSSTSPGLEASIAHGANASRRIADRELLAWRQKRRLLYVALLFAGFGLLIGLAGSFGWNLRPAWLAKTVGA